MTPGGEVLVRRTDGATGYGGLATCGSRHACPVCAAKIEADGAKDLLGAFEQATALGMPLGMMTLTVAHHAGQRLDQLLDAVTKGWSTLIGSRAWRRAVDRYGIEGFYRRVEVTVGPNGWHPHAHVIVFFATAPTTAELADLEAIVLKSWTGSATRRGLKAPHVKGQDLRLLTGSAEQAMASYLTKTAHHEAADLHGAALEVTQTTTKLDGKTTRSHWTLLAEAVEGDARARELWREYERATKGMKATSWSRDLRAKLALAPERSDEEVAAEQLGTADDDLVVIDARGWWRVCRRRLGVDLLDVAELFGRADLSLWLDEHGIGHRLVSRHGPPQEVAA